MHSKIKHHICYNMARTPSLWKFREGWGDIINQEHSTKQTLIFELVPWNLKICGFLTFRLFEFCCHFSTFRTFRLLLPLFDFSDFSTFRVLLPLFDFSDFSTFAATFRLFGLFDFSSFAATFRLFDFSTFRVFFHSSHLRPWMHPGSPTDSLLYTSISLCIHLIAMGLVPACSSRDNIPKGISPDWNLGIWILAKSNSPGCQMQYDMICTTYI